MNAADFRALMERWAAMMADHRDWLIQLDSVVGDSDLGLTMSDGFRAAARIIRRFHRRIVVKVNILRRNLTFDDKRVGQSLAYYKPSVFFACLHLEHVARFHAVEPRRKVA